MRRGVEAQFIRAPDVHVKLWPLLTIRKWGICIVKTHGDALERYERRKALEADGGP